MFIKIILKTSIKPIVTTLVFLLLIIPLNILLLWKLIICYIWIGADSSCLANFSDNILSIGFFHVFNCEELVMKRAWAFFQYTDLTLTYICTNCPRPGLWFLTAFVYEVFSVFLWEGYICGVDGLAIVDHHCFIFV